MDFSQRERNPLKHMIGIGIVVAFHVGLAYALMTGLAGKAMEVIKQPLQAVLVKEYIPPPPPPPPKKVDLPPPPKTAPPPPAFVPPVEVPVARPAPSTNVIAAVSNTPAPPAPPPAPAQPVRVPAVVEASACEKPNYPASSLRNQEEGIVMLSFLIGVDGKVVDAKVEKSSGYRELDKAARLALSLCKFKPGTVDGKPEQSWTQMQYTWKLD
jgi:protein TonB